MNRDRKSLKMPKTIADLCPAIYHNGNGDKVLDCVLPRGHKDDHVASERPAKDAYNGALAETWSVCGGITHTDNLLRGVEKDPTEFHEGTLNWLRIIKHGTALRRGDA